MTITLRSLDGTALAADVRLPDGATKGVVLVHGGGVDRHEGGFFDRIAVGLAETLGVASLQLDLRGHGESEGRSEDLTLAGVANDVRSALCELADRCTLDRISLLGASFSGGVCASVAARYYDIVDRLILINPLLDYKRRFVDEKDYWHSDRLDQAAVSQLAANRYIPHSPTFRLGRALLNEVFWWDARSDLRNLSSPTLFVHGTADTFIPIDSSRLALSELNCHYEMLELEGAQHGVAVHDDPQYKDPQTQRWQSEVVDAIAAWLA